MKKGALVLAVTNDLIFSAANVIIGVNKHSPDLFQDVILFVDCKNKLNRYEVAALNSIIDKEQNLFIYDAEELFPKVNHQDERLKNFICKYSKMPLVKLMIPNLFWDCQYTGTNEYEYILWLDSDICIVEDFSSILKFNGLSACLGSFAKPLLKKPENFPEISDTDIKPNGGMILFKKQDFEITKLGRNEYNEEIAKIIDKLLSDGALGIEELALTVFAKRKNIHLNIIPSEYNTLPKFSKNLNPKIVHALGKELKFWNNPIINIAYPEWNKNNEKWLQALMYAGVSAGDIVKYNKSKYDSGSLSNLIQRFEWIDYWSALMDRIQFSNQKIYQQTNISSRYVQFYFKGLYSLRDY